MLRADLRRDERAYACCARMLATILAMIMHTIELSEEQPKSILIIITSLTYWSKSKELWHEEYSSYYSSNTIV